MARKLRIAVGGSIARAPFHGGAAWAVLQYLLGFQRLGHSVLLVEPISRSELQPAGSTLAGSLNSAYFRDVVGPFGIEDSSALVDFEQGESVGLSMSQLQKAIGTCDVLVNLAGMIPIEERFGAIPIRVYLDLDPGFTQLWREVEQLDLRFEGHTHFVTIGLRIGSEECPVPTCGLKWSRSLQPVVLDLWPACGPAKGQAYTTIGNWRSYGSISHQGRLFGQKVHSWRPLIELPGLADRKFLVALSIHPGEQDFEELQTAGWVLVDPVKVAGTPSRYQEFIRGSRAELAIAKSGYVISNCGWFSERSACYLATGRPVIAENSGFSEYLPCGKGLFCFGTLEEILESISEVESSYKTHSVAAREIAEEFFDSDKVLSKLLSSIGASR